MADHPEMADPGQEMRPAALVKVIEQWAIGNGWTYKSSAARSECGKIVIHDPNDGSTYTTIPNPHKGGRLRLDQVRYTVRNLNNNWRD